MLKIRLIIVQASRV